MPSVSYYTFSNHRKEYGRSLKVTKNGATGIPQIVLNIVIWRVIWSLLTRIMEVNLEMIFLDQYEVSWKSSISIYSFHHNAKIVDLLILTHLILKYLISGTPFIALENMSSRVIYLALEMIFLDQYEVSHFTLFTASQHKLFIYSKISHHHHNTSLVWYWQTSANSVTQIAPITNIGKNDGKKEAYQDFLCLLIIDEIKILS